MRKEPIVFIVFAVFIGWKFSGMLGDSGGRARRARVTPKDYVSANLPDVDLALPDAARAVALDRDLFSPPSATSALPPLVVQLPPFKPLGALAPPTGWGPIPSQFGVHLRRPDVPDGISPIPGLFDDTGEEFEDIETVDAATAAAELEALADDPLARAAQLAGLKTQYDWIYTNKFKFGRIQNADRYELFKQDDPAISFVEVEPATGKPIFRGVPVNYKPEQVAEYGLVDNALTRVEVGFARFDDPLLSTQFEPALAFANECLLARNDTDRALEIAEILFTRAQAINLQDDARPRLGLATCYQFGFRLEDAYDAYRSLLESGHDTSAAVHGRLGSLLIQVRMPAAAELEFKEALRVERSHWEAHFWYGRFLLDNDRLDEALVHLAKAVQREPNAPEERGFRVRIRNAHAGALLRAGKMQEAFDAFGVAMSADMTNEEGLLDVSAAGMLTAARFLDIGASDTTLAGPADGGPVTGGFDVLLAAGLFALDKGQPELAAQTLGLAADADPFRRYEATRALSRVAEITGNPEDAVSFIEDALRGNPGDPWSLFQRGRLFEAAGDEDEARAAYRAALDVDLDIVPAQERMGAILQGLEQHDAAERFYRRAVTSEPERAILWSRRGWNALQSGDLVLAKTCLSEAKRLRPSLASARAGLAWWHYASSDSAEAITLFGEIVDDRRSQGAEDQMLLFAQGQADRISDHESKEVWRDRFDRAPGRVGNAWVLDQGFGPLVDLRDETVMITGQNEQGGRTRVFQKLPPDRFIAVSCLLTIGSEAKGTRSGLFLMSERTRPGGEAQVTAEVSISRNREGLLEVRVQKSQTDDDASYKQVVGPAWDIGQSVRVSIERVGDDLDSTFTLYVDGEPVAVGIECDRLVSSRTAMNFGAFVEGDAGRRADLTIDDVRVVRKR